MTLIELFKTGYDIGESIPREARARAAARERFGAAADDPGLFAALQQQELAQQQGARADRQLDLQERQEGRLQQTQDFNMETAQQERQKQAVLGLVNGLRQARDQGQDLGAAFDALADTLPSLGVDPKDIPQMRQALIDNPAILDQYYAALTDPVEAAKLQKIAGTGSGANQLANAEQVGSTIGKMREYYRALDEGKGIVNPDKDFISNTLRSLRSSWAGRVAGGTFGTENESFRRSIEGLRPQLLLAIKSAEELGAKMFDSNKDMELWLSTVTDPGQDIDTVNRLLDELEERFVIAVQRRAGDARPAPGATPSKPTIYPGWKAPNGMVFKGGDPGDQNNWEAP